MQNLQKDSHLQSGRYKILSTLGQGGFGITYLALQTGLERKVAIKEFFMKDLCNRDEATSHVSVGSNGSIEMVERFKAKFLKEARNIARFNHPNIIRILDVFEENGTAYYVMEYAEGGSLAEKVKRCGALPEPEAVRYILQVADALSYIHDQKMNHLDIKPANIMLNEKDDAILIDFGLSKQYDAVTGSQTSTTPVGISEGYAPMEQYKQGGVGEFSPETDVYSLGATFFKLLTGVTPPSASDVNEDGIPVDELKTKGVSQSTIDAICKAMEGRKKDRIKSIHEFSDLLCLASNKNIPMPQANSVANDDEETVLNVQTVNCSQNDTKKGEGTGKTDTDNSIVTNRTKRKFGLILYGIALIVLIGSILLIVEIMVKGDYNSTGTRMPSITNVHTNNTEPDTTSYVSPTPTRELTERKLSSLYIASIPSGAGVYIDGKLIGFTPIQNKKIPLGTHKIKLSKKGYEDKVIIRNLDNKPVLLNETLAEKPKSSTSPSTSTTDEHVIVSSVQEQTKATTSFLTVVSVPSGASVYVDGKWIGFTPMENREVSRGTHNVKLKMKGFEDKVFTHTFGDSPIVINETFTDKSNSEALQSTSATTPVNMKTFTVKGISFDMIQVEGGTFRMGYIGEHDTDTEDDEKPAHKVTLRDYYIAKTEVTQALWRVVMGTSPSHFSGDNLPVECVSWNDCQKFIRELNKKTGKNFRLPTEAEWEYAARGGNRSRGYKYSGSDNLSSVAWYGDNSNGNTHFVATKQSNELGIYDMSGNVYEWCSDWYDYYDGENHTNPMGANKGKSRVLRGGCWTDRPKDCRSSSRSKIHPSCPFNFIGFRLALNM